MTILSQFRAKIVPSQVDSPVRECKTNCCMPFTLLRYLRAYFLIFARAQRARGRSITIIFPYFTSKTRIDLDKITQTD